MKYGNSHSFGIGCFLYVGFWCHSPLLLAVDQISLSSDMKFEGRAAVLVITHESPAYSLTPQGQKEAEERAREFKLEREKQEAEKKALVEREKQAVQIKNEPRQPPVAPVFLVPRSVNHQVIALPERPTK